MPVVCVFHELGQALIALVAFHEVIERHTAIAVIATVEIAVDHPGQDLGTDGRISADAGEIEQPAIQWRGAPVRSLFFRCPM